MKYKRERNDARLSDGSDNSIATHLTSTLGFRHKGLFFCQLCSTIKSNIRLDDLGKMRWDSWVAMHTKNYYN